jgi:hypothetical protein
MAGCDTDADSDNNEYQQGGNNGGNGGGGGNNTFTPPTEAQLSEFLESRHTNPANKIAGEGANVYIKSITVNTCFWVIHLLLTIRK